MFPKDPTASRIRQARERFADAGPYDLEFENLFSHEDCRTVLYSLCVVCRRDTQMCRQILSNRELMPSALVAEVELLLIPTPTRRF